MPDSTLLIGTTDGHTSDGLVGFQDPFPTEELLSYHVRRFVETWMATMQGQTLQFKPSWNDCVNAYRINMAKGAIGALPPNLIASISPFRRFGKLNPAQINIAQDAVNYTDPVTGTVVTVANANASKGGLDLAAAGVATVVAQNDNLGAVALLSQDPGIFTGPFLHIRRTDANNWIRVSRQSATNLRVEKDVATVITTELDITIPSTEPVSGAAIGIRINGTNCKVFYNGTMYANFTLSAGAQGLAGTLSGVEVADVARHKIDAFSVWRVS